MLACSTSLGRKAARLNSGVRPQKSETHITTRLSAGLSRRLHSTLPVSPSVPRWVGLRELSGVAGHGEALIRLQNVPRPLARRCKLVRTRRMLRTHLQARSSAPATSPGRGGCSLGLRNLSCSLTIRSSRTHFATAAAWQRKLAMQPPPLRRSA